MYAWVQPDGSWWVNNAGAVAGGDGVLVIDTCATASAHPPVPRRRWTPPPAGRRSGWRSTPTSTVTTPTATACCRTTTVLIGHTSMREGLRVDPVIDGCPPLWDPVPDWGPVTRRLPDITVGVRPDRPPRRPPGRSRCIRAARRTPPVTCRLAARAERVLFSGDLVFAGLTPLVFMGSVTGALAALDWLAASNRHRRPRPRAASSSARRSSEVLEEHRRYYRFVLDTGREGRSRGLSPLAGRPAGRPRRVRRSGRTPSGSCSTCTVRTPTTRAASWTWSRPSPTPSPGSADPMHTSV